MRTGIEPVEAGLALMVRLAKERMTEPARHNMMLGDDDLQSGVGEEGRGRQSADAGANHSHVEIRAALGAAQLRHRPSISFERGDIPPYGEADEQFRAENGDQGADHNDAGRDPYAGPQHLRRRYEQEQHAPQTREDHVDRRENRALGGLGERRTGIIRGPGLSESHCCEADQTEPGE